VKPWQSSLVRVLGIGIGGAVAVWLAFALGDRAVPIYLEMGLAALVAIGLSLLMGFAGQISLGQGAFFALGAYTAGILTVGLNPGSRFVDPNAGIDPLLAVIAAPVVTAIVAAIVGVPLLRLRGHYLAFATLALHLIMLAALFAEERLTGGQDPGLPITKPLQVGGFVIADIVDPTKRPLAALVWALVAVALLVALNLVRSRAGRALQAIASGEREAAAAGIDVSSYRLRLFVFAAGLAGLAGALFAFRLQFLSPDAFPLLISIEFVVIVVVGGLGSVYGSVLGAVAIVWLRDELRDLGTREQILGVDLPLAAPAMFQLGAFALILIVVMLFMPRGVLPALAAGTRRLRRRAQGSAAGRLSP
jgi:branched-chain amino acid transport system permease protein